MTDLLKIVKRKGTRPVHELKNRKIVIELHPGDRVVLREERRRDSYDITLGELYQYLVLRSVVSREHKFNQRVKELIKQGWTRREAKKQARKEMESK